MGATTVVRASAVADTARRMTRDTTPPPDPARLVALLWREQDAGPRRGRPSRLDLARIVEADIALADLRGLSGPTMRVLA